jgi:dTDP-glucose 4,6-dehydratase
MNLLITGGAGFIGANFVRYWRATHPNDTVVILDSLTYAANLRSIEDHLTPPRCTFVRGDIRDQALVYDLLCRHELDVIVHFAAESHVDRSIAGPDAFVDANVVGTHSLLKAARQAWLHDKRVTRHRFHHVSTDEVYGSLGPDDPAFTERTPYAPNSPYSATKAGSDMLVRAYHHTFGLATSVTNCSNNYGPYQFPEKLIPFFLLNCLHGRPLPVYGDGLNVRDWLYVLDHCRAIDHVLRDGRPGETYNVGGDNEIRNIDLTHRLCDLVDGLLASDAALRERYPDAPAARGARSRELIRYVQDRPGHDRRYAVDASRIRRELGFTPMQDHTSAFTTTVRWYAENDAWWRPLWARRS